jgi:putative PEP-CTERM system histidine kinase
MTDKPRYFLALAVTGVLVLMLLSGLAYGLGGIRLASGNWLVLGQVLISVAGMVLLEQVWRNESYYKRSNIRYLCLGIGALFAYDFVLYSDALLFNKMSDSLWDSRGIIGTLCAPLIAMTMINSARQPIEVQISRQFVFHSSILMFTATYLLVIAAGGYYINKVGGEWSEALLVLFFFIAVMALTILGSSPKIRARLLVFISQNFFDYKYDYRDEWLRVTRTITSVDSNDKMDDRTIRVLAELVESPSGILWLRDEDNNFVVKAYWNMPDIKHNRIDVSSELIEFMSQSDWVIDLNEYQSDPTRYHLIEIPDCIFQARNPWLIVPLVVKGAVIRICRAW